jgi:hypothetical protein
VASVADGDQAALEIGEGLPPVAEAVFMSTDAVGTPGDLNRAVLEHLGLTVDSLPPAAALREGYAFVQTPEALLCFIVTVGSGRPHLLLEDNLRQALKHPRLSKARSLWIPLMGTGAGGLSLDTSEDIILRALTESGWASRPDVRIQISFPGREPYDAYGPVDRAVEALLRLASDLRSGLEEAAPRISTRLLLFALALADQAGAPEALAEEKDAVDFATALRARAGDRFDATWRAYFRPDFQFRGPELRAGVVDPTPNLAAIFRSARRRASGQTRAAIKIRDVVEALLQAKRGRQQTALQDLGVAPADLLKDFTDSRNGRVSLTLHNDVAATRDRLGYESYAKAITEFITHTRTPPPISVSIQAPWGVGKSSLMRMIQERLDPAAERRPKLGDALQLTQVLDFLDQKHGAPERPAFRDGRRWTVWFNAWKYETTEQVWAGLVDAIVSQVSARLDPIERELFLLRLQLARIDDGAVRRRIYDRVITIWWAQVRRWVLLLGTATLSLAGIGAAGHSSLLPKDLRDSIAAAGLGSAVTTQVVLAVYLVASYFRSREKTHKEPASFSLADYLKVPDYGRAVGSVHQIHADVERVLDVLPQQRGAPTSLVVFIDDLDRCAPASVASVVEGVSTFLASELKCVFVIGMDPQMVAAALENAHAPVRDRLPSYERNVPLGWRFMDKFVQLPFTIPPSTQKDWATFMDDLGRPPERLSDLQELVPSTVDATRSRSEAALRWRSFAGIIGSQLARWMQLAWAPALNRRASISPLQTRLPDLAEFDVVSEPITFEESRDVGAILAAVQADTVGNPREVKRLANLARFYLQLRNERRRLDETWRPPPPEAYARWIIATARWPDMMRWLLWGSDEATWPEAERRRPLVTRRLLTLESHTAEANPDTWRARIAATLNLQAGSDTQWLNDPKLFEFFQREQTRAASRRLSQAAEREFW